MQAVSVLKGLEVKCQCGYDCGFRMHIPFRSVDALRTEGSVAIHPRCERIERFAKREVLADGGQFVIYGPTPLSRPILFLKGTWVSIASGVAIGALARLTWPPSELTNVLPMLAALALAMVVLAPLGKHESRVNHGAAALVSAGLGHYLINLLFRLSQTP